MKFDDILFKRRRNGFFFSFDGLLSFAKMKAANLLEVWKDMGCALSLKN